MSELITLLEAQVTESDNMDSEVGEQRSRNHRYWSMQPLGNEQQGRSHYIDPRVFSAVEDKKAVYSETFLSSRQVVRFNGTNHDESAAKSAYAQRVLKANNYESLLRDGWHDAFVAKRMTVWVDWKRSREEVTLEFFGAPSRHVNAQLERMGDIVSVNRDGMRSDPIPSIGQPQFVHTGTLVVEVDRSYIDLDLIYPEYVKRDPEQTYAEDALWNGARIDTSKLALVEDGFDPEMVEKLKKDYRWSVRSEDTSRHAHDNTQRYSDGQRSKEQQEVTIYKTRTWLTPEQIMSDPRLEDAAEDGLFRPERSAAIYEIYWGMGEPMFWNDGTPAVKVLDEMAVYEWVEHKIAHSETGLCTADVEAHQQKAGSGLKRGVMDNMHIANNPGYEVNEDGIRDMRDLTDGLIAPIVTTDGAGVGQIKALDQPQLSPLVLGVMQMLDRDSESRSGMSDLARGMNQGAINNQNADSMVERLTTAGSRRVAMGVRDFANTFLVPLLQCIVRYGMKNDKSQTVMESGGRQIPIIPAQWSQDDEMEIEVALTPDEAQTMAGRLMMVDARLNQDEDMKPLYGVKQKHTLWDTVYELMGVKDSTKFLASPESPEVQKAFQQRSQMMQQEKQKQEQVTLFQMKSLEDNSNREWARLNNKIMDTMHDNDLDDKEFTADTYFKREELRLEDEQERAVAV